jgi:hypothetical protein
MYSLDMSTLTLTLHTVNPGQVNNWQMDWDFNIRVSIRQHTLMREHALSSPNCDAVHCFVLTQVQRL